MCGPQTWPQLMPAFGGRNHDKELNPQNLAAWLFREYPDAGNYVGIRGSHVE
jgi:hypothetical protein